MPLNINAQQLIEEAPVGVYRTTRDGNWFYANQALARMLGFDSVDELTSVPVPELYHRPDRRDELIQRLSEEGAIENFELELQKRDGTVIHCLLNAQYDGETLSGMIIDITDRRTAEKSLEESEEELREIFSQMQEGLYRVGQNGEILTVNQQMASMLGYEDPEALIGVNLSELIFNSPEAVESWKQKILQSGSIQNRQYSIQTRDGRELYVRENSHVIKDSEGKVKYFEGTIENITRQKQLEENARRNEHIQALGRIARGIAHDFNNVMATISGAAQMLGHSLENEQYRHYIDMILSSITRAKSITNRIQAFTQDRDPDMVVISARVLLEHVAEIVQHTIPENIDVQISFFHGPDYIRTDRGYLQQVLLNLCINATDAMPEGGTLNISLREQNPDLMEPSERQDNQDYLLIRITDTGTGMDEETLNKAFDPFFSTKSAGSGLGLSITHKLMNRLEGWITLESKEGEGTTATLGVPRSTRAARTREAGVEYTSLMGQGEHVLLVEDENALRGLFSEELHRNGYRLSVASSGRDALSLYRDLSTPPDLVITDIRMEGMDGQELLNELRALNSELPIIAFTGTPDKSLTEGPKISRFNAVLQKPVETEELLSTTRKVLLEAYPPYSTSE